jgi:L-threonylcarbamoyladenylate synthase
MPQVSLSELVERVRSEGCLASFPTDTVPALAVRPDRAQQIYQVKQRDLSKPLILMAASLEVLWEYVRGSAAEQQIWQQVAQQYLPGALTLVLPASSQVPAGMNPKDPTTIGIRVPNHPIAQAILTQTGALATTSANRSGQPALQTMPEIEAEFPTVLTLHPSELRSFSAAADSSGVPSTVVKWMGQSWQILRQGAVDFTC